MKRRSVLCLLVLPPLAARADEVKVQVERRGSTVLMQVEVHVPASLAAVWAVLTDYEHMASFLSVLKSSSIQRRSGEQLEVAQVAQTSVGPFKFSAASLRAIELTPMREIRTKLISGDFLAFDSRTTLQPREQGTLITAHSEYTPKAWLPPLLGPSMIESETRKQYAQLLAEVARRVNQAATAPQAP
jgi:carbon monoxide dehydrogenase subunit G